MAHEEKIIKTLEKLENKFDSLDNRLDSMDKTLVKQEANLGEHMRRTEIAEKQINGIQEDMKPVKRHVAMMEGALKAFGLIGVVVSIIAGIIKIFSFFHP